MRLKIFALFVAIQALSFGIWTAVSPANASVPAAVITEASVHPASESALDLNFQNRNMDEEKRFLDAIRQNQIETALKKLPAEHAASVKDIILDYSEKAHRGLGGNYMIIIRAVEMGTEEFVGVLIHETGHNVDYAFLKETEKKERSEFKDGSLSLYESDPSLDFYRISWENEDQRKHEANNMDFVSGYAMTDPFEDFAETYTFYVLHNKDFKVLASSSDALLAKYKFMKDKVFNGVEFDTGDGDVNIANRPWDTTVLSYDIDQFLS
jgi:hypothetical protein